MAVIALLFVRAMSGPIHMHMVRRIVRHLAKKIRRVFVAVQALFAGPGPTIMRGARAIVFPIKGLRVAYLADPIPRI